MSWSLRQSSWLRQRVLADDGAEYVGLLAHAQKPVGVLALTSAGGVMLWRHARGGTVSESWGQAPPRTRALAGHDPSQRLALVGAYGAQVWSLETREKLAASEPALGAIDVAAFAHDGALFTGGRDGCWRRWPAGPIDSLSASTSDCTVLAHDKPVRALAAHPRGEYLVSAGGDHALRVWDVPTGRLAASTDR